MTLLDIYFKRFFLNLKELLDGNVVSLTKREYDSVLHFLQVFIKPFKAISDE